MRSTSRKQIMRYVLTAAVVALTIALLSDSTVAQCVMCRASLGNNSAFVRNLNIGVLVLLVPPVTIFCTIFILAIRQRRLS
ncbi:MAG TPA: hypothetical protein VHE60_15660 [Pyrinomonadaceae bacterium]|nr:hypothetical protein [Pyrinomonadaceae bacterium]